MNPDHSDSLPLRSLVHSVSAVVIMGIYGGRVCPFVESLDLGVWMLELAVVFTMVMTLRRAVAERIIQRLPAAKKVAGQFWLELGLFFLVGVIVTLYDTLVYGFPIGSGLKMVLGVVTLGFFKGVDMGLARERQLAAESDSAQLQSDVGQAFFPIARKFAVFTTVTAMLVAAVLILVIFNDLGWMVEVTHLDPHQAKMAVLNEILFITAIFFTHIFNLILSYSSSLKLSVDRENQALMAVAEGDLSTHVSVTTNDEFGVMARYTNLMIQRLEQSGRDLQAAQRKLMEAERLRAVGEMASMIVHEIRSPLSVVQLALDYFDQQELAAGARNRLDLARVEVTRLGGLMNEILLFAKPQRLDRKGLELCQTLSGWMDTLNSLPAAQDRTLQLQLPEQPLWIQGDGDKLKQVLINLVANACEAVPPGEAVSITLEQRGEECQVEVHNPGEPIPQERLQRLTDPFFTTKQGGTGLGLPIVKKIVEAHGGSFSIASSEEGTRATLSFSIKGIA